MISLFCIVYILFFFTTIPTKCAVSFILWFYINSKKHRFDDNCQFTPDIVLKHFTYNAYFLLNLAYNHHASWTLSLQTSPFLHPFISLLKALKPFLPPDGSHLPSWSLLLQYLHRNNGNLPLITSLRHSISISFYHTSLQILPQNFAVFP